MLPWLNRRKSTILLIDGDNIPPGAIPSVLDEVCRHGRPRSSQVYLSQARVSWQSIAEENGLELVVVPSAVSGKNSVDIALAIEAMRHGFNKSVREIVLVSSDSDFVYLAHQLRALGKDVHGIGAEHTPIAFRTACSRFTVLSAIWAGSKARVPKGERFRHIRQLKRRVVQIVPGLADEEGWTAVQRLEKRLRERDARFDPRALGYRNIDQFLKTMKEVERHPKRRSVRLQTDNHKVARQEGTGEIKR